MSLHVEGSRDEQPRAGGEYASVPGSAPRSGALEEKPSFICWCLWAQHGGLGVF